MKFCPSISGKYVWNDIPLLMRNNPSKRKNIIIKSTLKHHYATQYLTIIPWAWMASESIAHEAEGRMG